MIIEIKLEEEQAEFVQKALAGIPKGSQTAMARALNRAATGGRSDVIKAIREEYTPKSKDIKPLIKIIKARQKDLTPVAKIISKGSSLALAKFQFRPKIQRQKGIPVKKRPHISVVIRKSDGPHIFRHMFTATMKSGHFGIWQRSGGITRNKKAEIVEEKRSLSVPSMMSNEGIVDVVVDRARARINKELSHQIEYLLRSKK